MKRYASGVVVLATVLSSAEVGRAQSSMPGMPMPAPTATPAPEQPPAEQPHGGAHSHEHGTEMPGMEMPSAEHRHEGMSGLLGTYPMAREASGTAWQPQAAPHGGVHLMHGAWQAMAHANAFVQYSDQGSDRGDAALDSVNMGMLIAERPVGEGRLGLKGMISLEPATVGTHGYPLLLQTGETGDGETPLVDRQHPHDFLMELAATFARPVGERGSAFVYVGFPGEPALGPAAYMHRMSGIENPETPLAHHWLDSTHITWGVVTGGWTTATWKVEASAFRGREPDEHRWDVEEPRLDSGSVRVTWNPSERWSAQASYGELQGPEQLEPEVDVDRTTASVSYVTPTTSGGLWGATLAWGRNARHPGEATDALLLEGTWTAGSNTVFARAEWIENDEIAHAVANLHEIVAVGEVNVGYLRDFFREKSLVLGGGASARMSFVPRELEPGYGNRRPLSALVMLRAAVR